MKRGLSFLVAIFLLQFLFSCSTSKRKTGMHDKLSIEHYIKTYRNNETLAFRALVKDCIANNRTLELGSQVDLKIEKAPIFINGPLNIKGRGKIRGTGVNNLFVLQDGASITMSGILVSNFKHVIDLRKEDISYKIQIDSIEVRNCKSFIHSVLNNQQTKKTGPVNIQGSKFLNIVGPVIGIRSLLVADVNIVNNTFDNKNLKGQSSRSCIEIGAGSNQSNGRNVVIAHNEIKNFDFDDSNKGSFGILVHGVDDTQINYNKLQNLSSSHRVHRTAGIFIKAKNSTIKENYLFNAGDGEASIINKGFAKNHEGTSPGTPSGDNTKILNNSIKFTQAYHKKAQKNITGILVTGSNQLVANNIIENITYGIVLRSGILKPNVPYEGGFVLDKNIISGFINSSKKLKKSAAGIFVTQFSKNVSINNNEISVTAKSKHINYIQCVSVETHLATENYVIENNHFRNSDLSREKGLVGVNFRVSGEVDQVKIKGNNFSRLVNNVVFNENLGKSKFDHFQILENIESETKEKNLKVISTKKNLELNIEQKNAFSKVKN